VTAGDAEREAILDAAAYCYLRLGVAKTTATDIAREVGISRATLYRRFGSHEAIFLALLTRESESMAAEARDHLAAVEDPGSHCLRHRPGERAASAPRADGSRSGRRWASSEG